MSKSFNYGRLARAVVSDMARASRQAEVARNKRIRYQQQMQKQQERELKQLEKEERMDYIESRIAEVEDMNDDLASILNDYEKLLEESLGDDVVISFDSMRMKRDFEEFIPPADLIVVNTAPSLMDYPLLRFLTWLVRWIPFLGVILNKSIAKIEASYQKKLAEHEESEFARRKELEVQRGKYEAKKSKHLKKVAEADAEVENFSKDYFAWIPEAVIAYNEMVLQEFDSGLDIPSDFRLGYSPESRMLVIEHELPTKEIVPPISAYKYIKSRDEISETKRTKKSGSEIYNDLIASQVLRIMGILFRADQSNAVNTLAFNGFIETVDPATGQDTKPNIISVRVTKEQFMNVDLKRVDKLACLSSFGARVSAKSDEIKPVKPIVDFNMFDRRFVNESDIISALDERPNLMDLNPYEFENLVTNLFSKMGLEAKLTRSSKDGGVDCVAFDSRPIVGGKVIIQAKRYKNTVGVSAVRDLYGTMLNEGASKGILVTTSGYGPDAYTFAKEKPIELLDGQGLLYLLEQQEISAKIVFPI